jgi:hypothetical protein
LGYARHDKILYFYRELLSEEGNMTDLELIATDAPVVRIKPVKGKRIKDKKNEIDKRPKVQNINPRRR